MMEKLVITAVVGMFLLIVAVIALVSDPETECIKARGEWKRDAYWPPSRPYCHFTKEGKP